MEFEGKLYIGNAPIVLTEATKLKRRLAAEKSRAEYLRQTRNTAFKYYCAICLIIRDENEYLEEWLRWHIGQGVEHFYIYDHESRQPVKEFITTLGKDISDKVTVTEWYGKHADAQPEAYNDCLNRYRGESRWIGFIDTDEQVRVKTGQTLPQFLKAYEEYAALFAVWLMYNANGQIKKTARPLRERFTRVSYDDVWASCAGKVFVQPIYMEEMVIHSGRARDGFDIVDEHRIRIPNYMIRTKRATTDLICVDHYYTKSYEEWLQKIQRGSGHAKYQRKYKEFFTINPDMEYCREAISKTQKYEYSEKIEGTK